jgi:hypothetical protein
MRLSKILLPFAIGLLVAAFLLLALFTMKEGFTYASVTCMAAYILLMGVAREPFNRLQEILDERDRRE